MTKIKITTVAAAIALLAAGIAASIALNRDPSYTPPPNPDPQKILQEAQADTRAAHYKEALAKHIWYRNNALRYQPSQMGVRNSFALMYWSQLAEKYPPAMKKLIAIRDDAIQELREKKNTAKEATADFITALSINNGLKEEGKNVDLFKWADAHNPPVARKVYALAETDLIQSGDYALCGRYMNADRSYQQILMIYNQMMGALKQVPKSSSQQLKEVADKMFAHQSARLVAVLAINNRIDEANQVAGEAGKKIKDPTLAALFTEAKNGVVPPTWP